MKTLVIAEKPSVARDIARVLGCSKKENGALEGNKYIVTWALGHLVTLKDPEDYDKKYKEWNMAVLPMMPEKLQIKVIPQTGKQYHAVTTQLARKDVNEIVIATDAGREGELVARWILDKAHNQKPCKRLWISSVTDKAIREGFANLKDAKEYDNLYRAAVSRAEADWLVGINATRALTCKYNAQLSCGRVQTPTLAMIAQREQEIREFVPKPYYTVTAAAGGVVYTWKDEKSGGTRISDPEKAKQIAEKAKRYPLVLQNVEKEEKSSIAFFWFFIKLQIFLMVLILGGLCFYYFGGYADKVAKLHSEAVELVQKSDKNTFLPARTSTLYDTNGDEISETATTKKADYVKYEDIPQNFVNCMVSIEDKKFYKHNGVDLKAIVRAAKSIIKNKRITQGGSTITMQLARNIYLDTNKNWQRKVKEMFIAMALEKKYSKNDIMEFYLNNVYFMNGYYGIQAACHGYFNCELSDLDLSQTAFLCAIPNSPTYYDPINNKDHTLTRRNLILKNLREDGKITQQEYEAAINEEITLNMPEKDDTVKYNYVDTYAYYCATRALMENEGFKFKYYFDSDDEEKEYDASYDEMYSYCQKKLYSDGYKIYTSIDLTMQQQLQDSIDLTLLDFTDTTDDGTFKLQSAATCIDNDTGEVVAIVGGRSQDAVSHTLNRAFQSHRQPGSSIKPLIVYTPSFERGKTPDTIVNDHKFDGGPSNSGDSYYGDVTIRFAVQKSLNTVAWQLYDELTPKVGLQYLKDMNFTNIVKDDYVTATALGGFTTGVSTLEMASAYSTLENDGMYRNPTCIKSIVDSDNNIIYTSSQKDTVIYTETASRMMTDVMTDV